MKQDSKSRSEVRVQAGVMFQVRREEGRTEDPKGNEESQDMAIPPVSMQK